MLSVKFHNDYITEMDVIDVPGFIIFEFRMSIRGLFYIAAAFWVSLHKHGLTPT